MSKQKLTDNEVSVLERGLTFIPSIKTFNKEIYYEELNRQTRKLMLLDYFDSDISDQGTYSNNSRFVPSSTWKPPWRRIRPETQKVINELNDVTNEILQHYKHGHG